MALLVGALLAAGAAAAAAPAHPSGPETAELASSAPPAEPGAVAPRPADGRPWTAALHQAVRPEADRPAAAAGGDPLDRTRSAAEHPLVRWRLAHSTATSLA